MVWPFTNPTDRSTSIRTGEAVPTRTERLQCWQSRDAYFACLDANSILDATPEGKDNGAARAARACPAQGADFERDCAAEWVRYFKKWRVAETQKRMRLEELRRQGAMEMEVTSQFTEKK